MTKERRNLEGIKLGKSNSRVCNYEKEEK